MDIERQLIQERNRVQNEIENITRKIEKIKRSSGDSKLTCSACRGYAQYFIDGKYISKENMNFIKQLAQLDYYEKLLKKG